MGRGGDCRVADGEREGGDALHARGELAAQVVGRDVEDGGVEDGAVLVHLEDDEAVAEGRDVEHVEEGGFGGAHLVALLQQLDFVLKSKKKGKLSWLVGVVRNKRAHFSCSLAK